MASTQPHRLALAALVAAVAWSGLGDGTWTGGGSGAGAGGAAAQTGDAASAYLAIVTADDVDVRAGAHFRYYSFGRVEQGDAVRVIAEKGEWARVETDGPTFREFFAYVRYPAAESGSVNLTDGGRMLITTGLVDLFAPNIDAEQDPSSSWKPILTLQPGRRLEVIDTSQARDERVHKVVLPADAQGWIKLEHLRRAAPSELAAWEAGVGRQPGAAAAATAAAPVVQGPAPSPLPPAPQAAAPASGPAPVPASTSAPAPADSGGSSGVRPMSPQELSGAFGGTIIEDLPPAPVPAPAPQVAPPKAPPVPAAPPAAVAKLRDLEALYARLLEEPPDAAEVDPLRNQFLDLAQKYKSSRAISSHANHRAKQLALWGEAQERQAELASLAEQAHATSSSVAKARWALETYGEYVAIGRLDASTVYDGERLPRLFRLRHAGSGQTIGYLQPDERNAMSPLLGEMVGIVGESAYDGSLQVTLIRPTRIDRLDQKGDPTAGAPPGAGAGAGAEPATADGGPVADAASEPQASVTGDLEPVPPVTPK